MNNKSRRSVLLEVVTAAAIVSLPIDLLYLYFAGGWNEPNQFILGIELGVLFLLPMFGIWRLYHFVAANGEKGRVLPGRRGEQEECSKALGKTLFFS
jgi:hypothetical protein